MRDAGASDESVQLFAGDALKVLFGFDVLAQGFVDQTLIADECSEWMDLAASRLK